MNVDYYRQQHNIMEEVSNLRNLIRAGIATQADAIARRLARMSAGIKFHLAAEDRVLYAALQASSDPGVVALGRRYQSEMGAMHDAYNEFAKKWQVSERIAAHPEDFRSDANAVFKTLHERIQKESRELYPVAERL